MKQVSHRFSLSNPRLNYVLMSSAVFVSALEFIFAKSVLAVIPPLTLILFKYLTALIVLFCIKMARSRRWPFRVRDIPVFILLAILGEVVYFAASYSALSYIPVALVTVIMALAPVLSIVFDKHVYRRKVRAPTILGICVSMVGVGMVAGVDPGMFANNRIIGYLLAFIPAICANIYNVFAIRLSARYSTFDMSFYIIAATVAITLPYGLGHLPPASAVNASLIIPILFIGIGVGAFGLFTYVNSLSVLGSTTTLLFLNFIPVISCVFGWLCLGETILPLQIIGGAILLTGCAAVIWFKDRTELYGKPL